VVPYVSDYMAHIVLENDVDTDSVYHTIDSFNDTVANSNYNFNLFHLNIRSFNRNSDQLFVYLNQLSVKPDVLVLTETWFTCDEYAGLRGYHGYHTCREGRRGGGVSVYVRDSFKSSSISEWSFVNDSMEICSVSIVLSDARIILHGIYRPPDRNIESFVDDMAGICDNIKRDDHVFFVGDLNIDIISPTSAGEDFMSLCYSSSFLPLINIPTHVTDRTSSCLDHIWYNKLHDVHSGAFDTDITDHYMIFATVQLQTDVNGFFTKLFRDHGATSLNTLRVEFSRFANEFSMFLEAGSGEIGIDELMRTFAIDLYKIYDKCCPIRSKRISNNRQLKPWISNDLMSCIRRKHLLYRSFKRGVVDLEYYNAFRNQVTSLIRRAKVRYYSHKFQSKLNDASATWKTINSLMSRKVRSSKSIEVLSGDRLLSEPGAVASCLNEYFIGVGNDLDRNIPLCNTSPMSYMGERVTNSFFINPVVPNDVFRIVTNLKSKSCPLYGLPTYILKLNVDLLSTCIAKLFNISVGAGKFPESLKESRVIPLFKSGNDNLVKNYRPISLLSDFSKIFEKLMYSQLIGFINNNDILCCNQFGFRKNCNTSDAIVEFLDSIYQTLDSRYVSVAVFLDFSKAFDTVRHDVLLSKLDHMGVRGHALDWFRSFVSGRRQYVTVNNVNSSSSPINIGVPQGSVLGPLLFLLYINDMHNSSNRLKFIHFADDTTVFHSGQQLHEIITEINVELLKIRDWLNSNRLSLNVGKTSFMLFCDRKVQEVPIVRVADIGVKQVSEAKFLGVLIDDKLNFQRHVSNITGIVSRSIGVMNRISIFVPPRVMKSIYYSLVFSKINYGVIAWGRSRLGNISIMEKILKRARRCVSRSANSAWDVTASFLNFRSIFEYFTAIKFYRSVKLNHHSYYAQIFDTLIPLHDHDTRFSCQDKYNIPHFVKSKCRSSFLFQSIDIWNGLTEDTKACDTLSKFKRSLKRELLHRQII